ncbi:MAG: hypothetical protein M1530_00900 [Candidatus Marsarchaeota archaeon]|nr:hypothetical protein [Candidatus Marsarchaeota archaeon]
MSQLAQEASFLKSNGWKPVVRRALSRLGAKFAHSQGKLLTTELDPHVTIKELIGQGRLTPDTNLLLKHYNLKRAALFSELVKCAGSGIFEYVNGADTFFAGQIIEKYGHLPPISQYAADADVLKALPAESRPEKLSRYEITFNKHASYCYVEETDSKISEDKSGANSIFYQEMAEPLKAFTKEWNSTFLNGLTMLRWNDDGTRFDNHLPRHVKGVLLGYLAWKGEEFGENAIQAMADSVERKLRILSNNKGMVMTGDYVYDKLLNGRQWHPFWTAKKRRGQALAAIENTEKVSSDEVMLIMEQTVGEYRKQVQEFKSESLMPQLGDGAPGTQYARQGA